MQHIRKPSVRCKCTRYSAFWEKTRGNIKMSLFLLRILPCIQLESVQGQYIPLSFGTFHSSVAMEVVGLVVVGVESLAAAGNPVVVTRICLLLLPANLSWNVVTPRTKTEKKKRKKKCSNTKIPIVLLKMRFFFSFKHVESWIKHYLIYILLRKLTDYFAFWLGRFKLLLLVQSF